MFAGVFMCDMHKPNVQMEVFFKHVQEHEELAPFLLQDADSNTITCWPTNAMLHTANFPSNQCDIACNQYNVQQP